MRIGLPTSVAHDVGAPLNMANPLTHGLVSLVLPVSPSPKNYVGSTWGNAWTWTGNVPGGVTPFGSGWAQLSTSGRLTAGNTTAMPNFSIAHLAYPVAWNASPYLSQLGTEDQTTGVAWLRLYNAAGAANAVAQMVYPDSQQLIGTRPIPLRYPVLVVGTGSQSSGLRLYVNGVLDISSATIPSSTTLLPIGFGYSMFSGRGLNGHHGFQALWNRALTDAEVQKMWVDSLSLFGSTGQSYISALNSLFRGWGIPV